MNIKKHIVAVLFLLILGCGGIFMTAHGAEESEQRVFDQAELLTDKEVAQLEERAAELRKAMKMDVVLVTTSDADGKDSRNYADDYYDYGGFGNGQKASGVLFLIDMDNREIYISTAGVMIRFLTDERIEKMLDRGYSYVSKADYNGTMKQFLTDVEKYYKAGIPGGQYNYDIETGAVSRYRTIRWYEGLIALVISAFCAFSACLSVAGSYEMKKERKQGTAALLAYRGTANYIMSTASDDLIDKSLTHMRIQSSSSGSSFGGSSGSSGRSSTHRSSSGRSHGGGGRKF